MYREFVNGKIHCRDCKNWFFIEDFQHHTGKDGKLRPGSYCKNCKRERGRVDAVKLRYGLSKAEFTELAINYPICAICGSKEVFVDHNHISGKVRGRLCRKCNTGLGMFHERSDLLDAAKTYLAQFS
jgi:hypothetical protein